MKTMHKLLCTATLLAMTLASGQVVADEKQAQKAQEIVDNALQTFNTFMQDPDMKWFQDNLESAKGLVIIPTQVQGAFILGASGGAGLAVGRDRSGNWSNPAFYNLGSVSFGLQAGGEASELILMIRSEKGFDKILTGKAQLGLDAGVALGPVGGATTAATGDILAFARSKGAFAGISLDGSVLSVKKARNEAYYDKPGVSAVDILIRRNVSNPDAAPLVEALTTATAAEETAN